MDFNPRAHEGHDQMKRLNVSYKPNFNPRAHEGHDNELKTKIPSKHFNPRAHEGHDLYLRFQSKLF